MGGQHAGGADPGGDQGGHAEPDHGPVQPPDLADPNLRSLPQGPGMPMPPDPPNPWVIAAAQVNPWNELKPKIVREPAPFKGESVDHWLTSSPHRVVFCTSRFEGEAQVWWDLQQRRYYSKAIGHRRYLSYVNFKKAVHDWFFLDANARLKYQALRKLHQTDFKSGDIFFQKFKELALEANIIDNEGQMAKMVEEAVCKTAKDTIYAQPNCPLDTYDEWKRHILQIDYNYHLNRATGGQSFNKPNNAGTSKGNSSTTTLSMGKTTTTGTTYGSRGQPMDIDTINNSECFQCYEKGHISKNCPLQAWNKGKKQEVRASMTELSTGSKIKEVKDAAGNGRTYYTPVVNALVSHMPHSILFTASNSNQPCKESHNRYAVLANDIDTCSSASFDKAEDETESLPSAPDNGANHLTSNNPSWHVKVPGDRPPTIVVPIITAARRPDGAGEPGPNSPPEEAAPRVEKTARSPTDNKKGKASSMFAPPTRATPGPRVGIKMLPPTLGGTGQTGKSAFAVQDPPDTLPASGPPMRSVSSCNGTLILKKQGEDSKQEDRCPLKAVGDANAMTMKKIAIGQEVTSTQAIERGHLVAMIEVPDEEDDTSFKLQQNKAAAADADACRPSPK
ncbi:hypothetical protein ARMSODRAFT_1017321 [Armillaria solidipes]|uniref:CCHC-type domain-containing protein n=1 Tax=Armillaria solidipes TaxID=1076256 RepID=A0A2H3BWR7_9AGAR|nr:hypothetical protein ARMSODRAFT_1017321 [Armillaria solidipes]